MVDGGPGMRLGNFSDKVQATLILKGFLERVLVCLVLRKHYTELFLLPATIAFVSWVLKRKSIFNYKTLSDIVVTDLLQNVSRFRLTYNLLNSLGSRIMLTVFVGELDFCNSVAKIFRSAGWLEREAWDLFGIYFVNHGDLRRILTDYGFRGFPFRKDFPLTGYIELRFDDARGDVVYEPVELAQELRFFNFAGGWELD